MQPFLVYFRVRNMEKKPLLLVFDPCSLQQPQEREKEKENPGLLFFLVGRELKPSNSD